jgi:hypothetical protein
MPQKGAIFVMEMTGKEGRRGTSWDGGVGGGSNGDKSISLLWQMSSEESTKDAKNWKNVCV